MREEVNNGQILKDSNEFGFDPKGNRDSLKNFKQGFNLIQGEGNGTPFQYSCLENPMDGGAW